VNILMDLIFLKTQEFFDYMSKHLLHRMPLHYGVNYLVVASLVGCLISYAISHSVSQLGR